MLVARLVVLCAPPHHSAFKVDVRPSKLTDGADAVSCLVCEDQSAESPQAGTADTDYFDRLRGRVREAGRR